MRGRGNFVEPILRHCRAKPQTTAIVIPEEDASIRITYGELERDIAAFQAGLAAEGLAVGDRVVLLFGPDRRFYALLLALLASGMVPVFIDGGMGRTKILQALEDAKPKAVITMRALLRWRWLLSALRRRRCYCADGEGPTPLLDDLFKPTDEAASTVERDPEDHGLITFTSGSTGRPKGADRTHGLLLAQHAALDTAWPLQEADKAVTALPVFLLHGLGCGVTSIIADCDLAKPGAVDPARLVAQLEGEEASLLVGAPAFMKAVAGHLAAEKRILHSLRTVFVGGAPSSPAMVASYVAGFSESQVHIVYGSTEAEPIALVPAEDILAAGKEALLVGKPVSDAEVSVVAFPENGTLSEPAAAAASLPPGEVGEILVKGRHVLKRYVDNPEATRETKIPCADGEVWHRTGDRGYFDEMGRLWLTGRDRDILRHGERCFEVFPLEIEMEAIEGVRRGAAISPSGLAAVHLFVEAEAGADRGAVRKTLRALLPGEPLEADAISFLERIPVDGRHNSKVDRPKLRQRLAQSAVGRRQGERWIVHPNPVDWLTLLGGGLALGAVGLVLAGHFGLALALLSAAMLLDGLDGYLARRLGTLRPFGRYLDGFVDVLDYLFVPSLFLYLWGFSRPLDCLVLLVFFAAGVMRLAVFNEIGNQPRVSALPGYLGMPVFWSIFILWGAYLLALLVERHMVFWILDLILLLFAAAMLHNASYFKFTKLSHLLMLPGAGLLLFGGLGLMESAPAATLAAIETIGAAALLTLPCVIGISLHMVFVARDWLPVLKIPIHEPLFGANKTWRGFVLGPPLCILGAWPTVWLAQYFPSLSGLAGGWLSVIGLGLAMGLAYMLLELPNSFLKRRLGIAPGGQSKSGRWFFIALDQIDSGIGIALCGALLFDVPGAAAWLVIPLFPFIALAVKQLLFALKLKKTNV